MKNIKKYENYKRIINGSKIVLASAAGTTILLFSGCSGCATEVEPEKEVVTEVPDIEPEIEIIETDIPVEVEEIKEEIKAPEKIELNLADGAEYQAQKLNADDTYNYLSKIESLADNKYSDATDYYYKRDCMIALFCIGNTNCLDQDSVKEIADDYLTKWSSEDLTGGVFNGYYVNNDDYIDNVDLELFVDPVYQNEMEIFNYYVSLYLNENDETKKSEYADILNSSVYGNEYNVFPLTFDENNYKGNYGFVYLLNKKLRKVALEKYNDNDADKYVEFTFDENYRTVLAETTDLVDGDAQKIAGSIDTMIVDGSSYIPSHKGKVLEK